MTIYKTVELSSNSATDHVSMFSHVKSPSEVDLCPSVIQKYQERHQDAYHHANGSSVSENNTHGIQKCANMLYEDDIMAKST